MQMHENNITEQEALYELPEGWKWTRLGDCSSVISKGTTPKGGKDAYLKEGVNFLSIENLNEDGSINLSNISHISIEEHEGNLKRSILEEGDLLISIAGTLGKVGFVTKADLPMNTNQAIAFIRLYKDIFDNMYLKYAIESPFVNAELLAKTKVTSIPNLTLEIISNCLIPLPPTLTEQQRIVNRIETMFAKLDQAQEKAQAVLDSFETRKAAILHKAFNGQLTANWRKENGVSDDSWEEKLFDSCIAKMQNGISKRSGSEGEETVVLRLANIGENDFDVSDLRTIKLTSKEQDNYSLTRDDVVMIRVNGSKTNVGRQILVKNNNGWSFCDHIIRIKYETFCMPSYMVYFSHTKEYKDYVQDNMVSSVGQNTISRKGLSNLRLKIPTLPEQQAIVRILDTVLEKENRAKEAAQTVLDEIALLKKSILARAFRGEL